MIRTFIAGIAAAAMLAPTSPAFAASRRTDLTPSVEASRRTDLTPSVEASRRTDLTLSYEADAGYAAAVVLRCDPPGGGHPEAAEACRTLANVDGNPSYLRPAHRYCFLIYAPITARITGKWQGTRVNWSRRFGNSCEMRRATGVLFEF